jgi:hypothetical protein
MTGDDDKAAWAWAPTFTATQREHFAAIGELAVHWSYFEAIVDLRSSGLAGLHQHPGLCFTSQIFGIGRKLDTYLALAQLRDLSGAMLRKLNLLADAARGLGQRRDRIIHDTWYFWGDHPPHRVEISAKQKLSVKRLPMTTAELSALIKQIGEHGLKFQAIHELVAASALKSEQ